MSTTLDEHGPRQVGPYRLLGRLGAGGMGQVFLGVDAAGRQAAVKIVHPGLAHDPRFRARFAREVAAGRRVHGRWTAEVLDADPDATPPWLATEYVAGPSLDQVVRDVGSVPADAMARLALGLAQALVAIHGAGLLHRDVKPSNVLLTDDGPRLIDFGIAQAVDGTRLTSTGGMVGTPGFMSPEQVAGEELGPASDVFSLGGVLVFAATGTGPFGTAAPLVLLRRVLHDPPDLGALDGPLREVAAACLSRDPAARPTPAQLAERLEPIATERPGWLPASVTAVAADGATRKLTADAPRAPRRVGRRVLLGGAALVGVGAAAGLLSWWRAPKPAVRWSFPAGGPVHWLVIGAGTVFVGTNGPGDRTVTALDVATGQSRWSHPNLIMLNLQAAGPVLLAGHSVLDARTGITRGDIDALGIGDVYAARPDVIVGDVVEPSGRDHYLGAFDPVSRASRWRTAPVALGCSGSAVTLSDDVALVLACDAADAAFDLVTGAPLWTWPADDPYRKVASSGNTFYRVQVDEKGGPMNDSGYGTTGRTTVEAADARSGTRRWSAGLDAKTRNVSVVAGQVYVGNWPYLYAHDGLTGADRWAWTSPKGYGLAWIAGSDSQLAVAGESFSPDEPKTTVVVSVDPTSGSTRWQLTLPGELSNDLEDTALAVAGDTVLAAVGSTVYAISAG